MFDSTTIDCKLLQQENAESPIDVTLVGMQYDENLCLAIKDTILSRFFENRIPSIEQNCWLLDSTRMDSKLQQPEKDELQILAILENSSYWEDGYFGGIQISWLRFFEYKIPSIDVNTQLFESTEMETKSG